MFFLLGDLKKSYLSSRSFDGFISCQTDTLKNHTSNKKIRLRYFDNLIISTKLSQSDREELLHPVHEEADAKIVYHVTLTIQHILSKISHL